MVEILPEDEFKERLFIIDTFIAEDTLVVSKSLSITRFWSALKYWPPVAIALIVYVSVGFSITDILEPPTRVMLFESLFLSRFTKFKPVFPSKDIYIYIGNIKNFHL